MATLVKFLKEDDGDIFAYFPQLKADNQGNRTCYAHIGQHSACSPEYAADCLPADNYAELQLELISIGYDLKILNK